LLHQLQRRKRKPSVCTNAMPPKYESENIMAFCTAHLFTLNLFQSVQQAHRNSYKQVAKKKE
jgi:hypothetical protein